MLELGFISKLVCECEEYTVDMSPVSFGSIGEGVLLTMSDSLAVVDGLAEEIIDESSDTLLGCIDTLVCDIEECSVGMTTGVSVSSVDFVLLIMSESLDIVIGAEIGMEVDESSDAGVFVCNSEE